MCSIYRSITLLNVYFLGAYVCLSQTLDINGVVLDSITQKHIYTASVVLNNTYTKEITAYTTSEKNGSFFIKTNIASGIYSLKVRHLNYNTVEKSIVVADSANSKLNISIKMLPKINVLDEVIVQKAPPIIIKKDTVIYDIQHFKHEKDQTLEETLARIDGFQILKNGEIKVNGKIIRKILVNGEEVTNAGASMLTKSIDPENVKEIEVRFDEQSAIIKESLLNTKEYVVLDVKMKEGFDMTFFGKARVTVGYQNQIELGGYANIFSLNKKAKVHLFGEHDKFGHQTISLLKIRNIGQEAFNKLFELPSDFSELVKKEAWNSEIYGFNDFTTSEKSILGITTKLNIKKHISLFFGSYNSQDLINKGRNVSQTFSNTINNSFEKRYLDSFSSKNKAEMRADFDNTKIRLDVNFVFDTPNTKTQDKITASALYYDFEKKAKSSSFYNNLFFEQILSENMGLEFKLSYSKINSQDSNILLHNDTNHFFTDKNLEKNKLTQKVNATSNQINSQLKVQYQSPIGVFETGGFFEDRTFEIKTESPSSEYAYIEETYGFKRLKPFLVHIADLGDLSVFSQLDYSYYNYSTISQEVNNGEMIGYTSTLGFDWNGFETRFGYQYRLASFPMRKLNKAKTLINYQIIEVKADNITPKGETIIEFSIGKKINQKLELFVAMLFGKNQSSNRFFSDESYFFISQRNQLGSSYRAFSSTITKKLNTLPITIKLEPEALFNDSENISSGISYQTKTKRWLLGFKAETNFKNKIFNVKLYPKYTKFNFENTLSHSKSTQEMMSLKLNSTIKPLKEKLFIDFGFRQVYFFGNIKSSFKDISLNVSGTHKKFNWFLTISNITNDSEFIIQSIHPNFFMSNTSQVFERYFKFGIEYKFD